MEKNNGKKTQKEMNFHFEDLRKTEYSRLDDHGHVYLDYTGAALYPSSLIQEHAKMLSYSVLGNPHSLNPTSKAATDLVEETRLRVLSFFNADVDKYDVIFTANASGAAKLIGESFPFRKGSTYLLTADNHNSVLGIREYARRAGACVKYIPLTEGLRAHEPLRHIMDARSNPQNFASLFAFPAQSNFSGVKHSLNTIDYASRRGWYTLLDAAAYVPSSALDLSKTPAHFIMMSFYKMFGYPTGIGALIVRRSALRMLKRPWFAGGTVKFASVATRSHVLNSDLTAFEDGTINFTNIPAVISGLDFLQKIGMVNIQRHVETLTTILLTGLLSRHWQNGKSKFRVHGPNDTVMRGGTVAFDVLLPDGGRSDSRLVEQAANDRKISLRTGCFCNPGVGERAMKLESIMTTKCIRNLGLDISISTVSSCAQTAFVGTIRASVGLCNNMNDLNILFDFLDDYCATLEQGQRQHNDKIYTDTKLLSYALQEEEEEEEEEPSSRNMFTKNLTNSSKGWSKLFRRHLSVLS